MPHRETGFTMDTSSFKFGPGITGEVDNETARLGFMRVMVYTDTRLAALPPVDVAKSALQAAGVEAVLYDRVRTEPTDTSFRDTIAFAADGKFNGYVAVGGDSAMDTAK